MKTVNIGSSNFREKRQRLREREMIAKESVWVRKSDKKGTWCHNWTQKENGREDLLVLIGSKFLICYIKFPA